MKRPPHGLCLPVVLDRVIDGDSVVVRLEGSALVWTIRISGVDCPELSTDNGKAAREFTADVLTKSDRLSLQVRAPRTLNLLDAVTFGRISGDLWVTDCMTLGEMLLLAGHAVRDLRYAMINPLPEPQ